MSVNKWIGIGNLGGDPEVKYTAGGDAVANFNIACSERWKDKQGNPQERTEWVRIVAFGRLAELCGEHLSKGRQVYVEGKLATRSYEKDGVTRYVTEIKAQEVRFLGARGEGAGDGPERGGQRSAPQPQSSRPQPSRPQAPPPPPVPDEEIPF